MQDVTLVSLAAAAMAYALFGAYLTQVGRRLKAQGRPGQAMLGATVASVAWALLAALDETYEGPVWHPAASALDLLRYAFWFAYLLVLMRPAQALSGRRSWLESVAGASLLAGALATVAAVAAGAQADAPPRAALALMLALPLTGLLLLEQLLRGLAEDSRWAAKPVVMGLACIFAFDLYLQSAGLLFGRYDADVLSVRGAVNVLAVPFLFMAVRRGSNSAKRLQVSRTAALHSATLVLAGAYLLFMSGIGYYVRYFGGTWGRALQLSLLVAALAVGISLALSGSLRSWLRVFVGKHFFSYRYDYREEWLHFTRLLSTQGSATEVGSLVVRGLARMVECSAGSLWMRAEPGTPYCQVACLNAPRIAAAEPPDSAFTRYLRLKGWVIDINEYRRLPRVYGNELTLPAWLIVAPEVWVVVPLLAGDALLGFVLLMQPRTAMTLDWEVRDLLKTAGRQAAGYLAQLQATEALLEARKFEAFNRMSAFVVHDLKNIVTQLSLMLKNAERLHDNKEFQQDMLLTVESSLEKMRRLMLQLREGGRPAGVSHGVDVAALVQRLRDGARSQGRAVALRTLERLATRGHEERLERVLGHFVQNALEATPPSGEVWMDVQRYSGQVQVMVGDTGSGMSEEFVANRLFRPFSTTKAAGMGIGTYESQQYIHELGGSVRVSSRPGAGTTVTVLLPLFDVTPGSDILRGPAAERPSLPERPQAR